MCPVFYFFKTLEKKLEILLCVGKVEALLQFLVYVLACANCKWACFSVVIYVLNPILGLSLLLLFSPSILALIAK